MHAATFWDQAMTPEAYVDQMKVNRDVLERRILTSTISDSQAAAFEGRALRILILTEDYCGDSAQFIPPVVRLGHVLDNVEVRILLRNEHRELAQQYVRKDGYQAIPVFILLDEGGSELGYLIERPQRVYDILAAETRRFAQENPSLEGVSRTYDRMPPETKAAVIANAERFRETQQALWAGWFLDDLVTLLHSARSTSASAAD